jgi:hypothetical protein
MNPPTSPPTSPPTNYAIDTPTPPSGGPQAPGGLGGFLESNASTIGSIGGGILGELVDPFGGAIAGSALGGGLGQELSNATTGSTENPLEAAAIGGASELGGQLIGKAVSKGAQLVKGAAPNVFKSAFNLTPKLNSLWKAADTSKSLIDYGITGSIPKMLDTSGTALDALDNLYRQSVGTITSKIDTTGARDAAQTEMDSMLNSFDLTDADKKMLTDQLEGKVGANGAVNPGLLKNENGIHSLNAQDAVDRMRTMQEYGHTILKKATSNGITDPRKEAVANTILSSAKQIQNALDDATSKTSIDALKTEANVAPLREISPKLADAFMAAKTPQEIRSLMEPFVNLRRMAGVTLNNPRKMQLLSTLIGGAAGLGIGGAPGAAVGAMVGTPLLEGVEQHITAPIVTNAAKAISKLPTGTAKAGGTGLRKITAGDVTSKLLAQVTGRSLTGTTSPTNGTSQNVGAGPVSNAVNSQVQQAVQATHQAVNQGMPDYNSLVQSVGIEGANAYMNYWKMTQPEVTQEQQTQIIDATKALQGVQALASQYDKIVSTGAGLGQLGQLGTNIPGIQNLPSEAALKAYDDNINDLAATIASVLGSGRSSAAMLNELKSELPSVTDSPMAAQTKFSLVINRLNEAIQGTLAAPAINTPGQLTNFANQSIPGLPSSTGLIMPPGQLLPT